MSAYHRRSAELRRDKTHGQHFLVDLSVVDRIIASADIRPGETVVDIGAGRGHLTIPLARSGARVIAVERDSGLSRRLRDRLLGEGLADRVEILMSDFRSFRLPAEPFRVVANPPFGLTGHLLTKLFDDVDHGLHRADLVLQREVVRQRTATPPKTLRDAARAPWWWFERGVDVPRHAFRPVPGVDATVLIARRRDPPVLPEWLAPQLRDLLRKGWSPPVQTK